LSKLFSLEPLKLKFIPFSKLTMTMKFFQRGAIRGDIVTLLIAGLALVGLLAYAALSGVELPLWPSLAVMAVNLFAAGRLAWTVLKSKKRL